MPGSLRIGLAPLRVSRDFRLLFAGRSATLFGSQITEVALLVQVKQLTGSALAVGLLGMAELVPLVLFGLYGGTLADRLDRRTVALYTELGLGVLVIGLVVNAALPEPLLWPLYAGAAGIMSLASLQRPSLDAALPRVVHRDRMPAAVALSSLSHNVSAIVAPAMGGLLAAGPGPMADYVADIATFVVSLLLLLRLRPLRPDGAAPKIPVLRGTWQAARYAWRRPELLGSYLADLADLAAMIFAFPNTLFPFVADDLHADWALGLMYSATAMGAVCVSVTSLWAGGAKRFLWGGGWATGGRTGRVRRHGRAIVVGAAAWGLAITGFGLSDDLGFALVFLVVAGGADMVSGLFRQTLWNQTIPDEMRGRLAGIELLSYGLGPSLGQLRSGGIASVAGVTASLCTGGLACLAAVGLTCAALPRLWSYRVPAPGLTQDDGM